MKRRWQLVGVCLGWLAFLSGPASAQTNRYAIIVAGPPAKSSAKMHREWVDSLAGALRGELGFDAAHLIILTETPQSGETVSNAVNVKAALQRIAPLVKKDDELFVMLIGHGSGSGADAKFNLVGPDLTAAEWNELLKPVLGRVAFVNAASASAGFSRRSRLRTGW
jgi:hypothetical protein